MRISQAFAILLILATQASAGPAVASESNRARALAAECAESKTLCEEYLLGAWDAVLIHGGMTHQPLFCAMKGPTGDELLAAFNQWVVQNPDKLELSRAVGALLALKHAYPCSGLPNKG